MSLNATLDFDTKYVPLEEQPPNQDSEIPKKLIAGVLKDINGFSKRFVVMVLLILDLMYFVVGMHIFTFVYIFLAPEFVRPGNPSQNKTPNPSLL